MTWQQIVIAMWLAWAVVHGVMVFAKSRAFSSAAATFGVFLIIAIEAAVALVLHSGGFW